MGVCMYQNQSKESCDRNAEAKNVFKKILFSSFVLLVCWILQKDFRIQQISGQHKFQNPAKDNVRFLGNVTFFVKYLSPMKAVLFFLTAMIRTENWFLRENGRPALGWGELLLELGFLGMFGAQLRKTFLTFWVTFFGHFFGLVFWVSFWGVSLHLVSITCVNCMCSWLWTYPQTKFWYNNFI